MARVAITICPDCGHGVMHHRRTAYQPRASCTYKKPNSEGASAPCPCRLTPVDVRELIRMSPGAMGASA